MRRRKIVDPGDATGSVVADYRGAKHTNDAIRTPGSPQMRQTRSGCAMAAVHVSRSSARKGKADVSSMRRANLRLDVGRDLHVDDSDRGLAVDDA